MLEQFPKPEVLEIRERPNGIFNLSRTSPEIPLKGKNNPPPPSSIACPWKFPIATAIMSLPIQITQALGITGSAFLAGGEDSQCTVKDTC